MLNNHPAYVAYFEVGQSINLHEWQVKQRFRVSRRINRLSALMNFLHTNLELTPNNKRTRYLKVERFGNLIQITLRESGTRQYLDSWIFRCGKNKEDISDARDTYFMTKDLCMSSNYGNPGETARFKSNFSIFNHMLPLHSFMGKTTYTVTRSDWLKMTTMTITGCGPIKSYCLV